VYTYVPAGATYAFVVTTGAHATTNAIYVSVGVDIWEDPERVSGAETSYFSILANNLGGMNTSTVATKSMFLRPKILYIRSDTAMSVGEMTIYVVVSSGTLTYTPSATTAGIVACGSGTTTLLTPLSQPPEFAVTERPWMDTRVTASALLLTNVTKVLNKEGTVLAGRLRNTSADAWNFTASSLSVLHPAEKSMLALETGFYTYAPPSTDLQTFHDYTYDANGVISTSSLSPVPVFALSNTAYVNCFVLTDSDAATPSSFAANLDWHIEFRNTSTLFPIGMSGITLEAFHQAILNLVSHGFFFCNNEHKSKLNAIFRAGKALAPSLVGLLPPPARLAAQLGGKAMNIMLSSKPRPTPPTTSAKSSGMIPAKVSGKKTGKKNARKKH
jgi:hypothetical protein